MATTNIDLTESAPGNDETANKALCSWKDIFDHEFDIGSTRDIPKLVWPKMEQVKIGTALEIVRSENQVVRRVYDFAYLCVDSDGSHAVFDGADVPLSPAAYHPDPAFSTEMKIKGFVLRMLEHWCDELEGNLTAFDENLSAWRFTRREWEMDLVKPLEEQEAHCTLRGGPRGAAKLG
ncbi:hypothetical protein BJY01DRAFT_253799 [Aspergillus pseudoustus]|uniref:Uncharacterized protein n=1 Tax=Aspergillus pseudoustus TaxID=1810923 RepID=A0ABR4IY42_9EURO